MANMGKTSKRQVAIRLDLHLCRAVEKKFRRKDDTSEVTAYIRALEDSTRDVLLTASKGEPKMKHEVGKVYDGEPKFIVTNKGKRLGLSAYWAKVCERKFGKGKEVAE